MLVDEPPSPARARRIVDDVHGVRIVRRVAPGGSLVLSLALLVWRVTPSSMQLTNADALLPALMSTQKWTPFYWGQDRLFNLLPLLAAPIRNPLWNFHVQTVVLSVSFFGVVAMFSLLHVRARRQRVSIPLSAVATLVAGIVVVWPLADVIRYRFIVEQMYFFSALMWAAAMSLWLGRCSRWAVAVVVLIAAALNPSIVVFAPLIVLFDNDDHQRIRRAFGFTVLGAAAAVTVSWLGARFGPVDNRALYSGFDVGRLPAGIQLSIRNLLAVVNGWAVLALVLIAGVVLAWTAVQRPSRALLVYPALVLSSGLWLFIFSMNDWVGRNHDPRYFFPLFVTLAALISAAVTECLIQIRWRLPDQLRIVGSCVIHVGIWCLALVASWAAVDAIHGAHMPVVDRASAVAEIARDADANLVVGDYWAVWPVVVAGRAVGDDLLGVSFRSDPILDEIKKELSQGGDAPRVLCLGADPVACADVVTSWTEEFWFVDEVVLNDPLIISVAAAGSGVG